MPTKNKSGKNKWYTQEGPPQEKLGVQGARPLVLKGFTTVTYEAPTQEYTHNHRPGMCISALATSAYAHVAPQ